MFPSATFSLVTMTPSECEFREQMGARIQAAMKNADENQTSLAEKAKIDRTVFSRILSGARRANGDQLGRIARVLDVTAASLMPDGGAQAPAIRGMSDPGSKLPPGLEAYLGRHGDDVTPRERRQLETIRFKLEAGAKCDDVFWAGILAVVRVANASKPG